MKSRGSRKDKGSRGGSGGGEYRIGLDEHQLFTDFSAF